MNWRRKHFGAPMMTPKAQLPLGAPMMTPKAQLPLGAPMMTPKAQLPLGAPMMTPKAQLPLAPSTGTTSRVTGLPGTTLRRLAKTDPSFPQPFTINDRGDL